MPERLRTGSAPVFLLGILLGLKALAQNEEAATTGTVQHGQGRAISGAIVEARQEETNLVRSTKTSAAGTYLTNGLPIGRYSVTVSCAGFSLAQSRDIRLFVGQTRNLDAALRVAGVKEQVTVTTSASEVDQTTAAIGGRMEQSQIQNLPINGRNWASLLPLTERRIQFTVGALVTAATVIASDWDRVLHR
jgi:Carboxypeptidase regulatory-like domain